MRNIIASQTQPEPCTWIAVPGTKGVLFYPLIRKPSVTCSNTFIIKSPRFFIIIDPGTDLEQIEHTRKVVLLEQPERFLPVFIFLTHCHIDHFLAAPLLMDQTFHGQIICHPLTAEAIENRDGNLTLANMNGSELPECRVKDCFFEPRGTAGEAPLSPASGSEATGLGHILPRQVISLGEQDRLEVYHTPGHSPDSVSYRIGNFICTGDLHLATTPGIAGKSGWDNNKLAFSLRALAEKGRQEGLTHVFPGHGNALNFDKAEGIFMNAHQEALQLTDLVAFDRGRSLYISEYAIVLLEEASSIFSIIAGRLLKISYYLEMLEESEKAEAILQALDSEEIDKIVEEFQHFIDELKGKRGAPIISKAVQFTRRINKLFEPERIAALFDPYFLRRIKNLLSDFVNVVYGARFGGQESLFELNRAIEETLAALQQDRGDGEKIFASLDDDQEFVGELTRRIATTPLFLSTRFNFYRTRKALTVTADRLMFQDLLAALLEQFAISEITHINLQTAGDGKNTTLTVTPEPGAKPFVLRDSKTLYLRHSLKLAGGEFRKTSTNGTEVYRFIFSQSSEK